jgi:hypothetical protein
LKSLDHYLETAIENIEKDREVTRELLDDVIRYVAKDETLHKGVGQVAAKYVETLQRSNEQLVKIASILEKRESKSKGLSEFDKEELYNIFQEESS